MRCGWGFGFRGFSPPWPYVGRGRGGLPRCWYPSFAPFYAPSYIRPEEEVDFLKREAEALRARLGDIERRIEELEKGKGE